LQRYGPLIERELRTIPEGVVKDVLESVLAHYMTIPRVEQNFTEQEYQEEIQNRWLNLKAWFVGRGSGDSEAYKLLDITNGIIRKITRYAYRIAESQNRSINRKKEYMHLCKLFAGCQDIKEAHSLSAAVFGAFHTRHVVGDFERETESISSKVLDEPAFEIEIKPRTRQYREKSYTGGIRSREEEKRRALEEYLQRQKEEQEIVAQYIKDNYIRFADLPEIEPFVRSTLLRWVGRALGNQDRIGKTEDGRTFRVHISNSGERIVLRCQDGNLEMPAMVLEFLN
jgi:uncharacterized protein (TIGR02677 family)